MPDLAPVHNARKTKHLSEIDRAKRNSAKRCYSTSDPTWRRLRAVVLASEPLCRDCRRRGRITSAVAVDHIDGDTFNNLRSNLCPLCTPCHTRKTNKEDGAGFR